MESENDCYRIQLLGEFSVTQGEECLSDAAGRMQQVWNLIEYLIVNRHKTIPQGILLEMLWPDDRSENPANALKNLVYRARTLLSKAMPGEERPFIIFRRNTYAWNNDLPCEIDIEQVEQAWREAGSDNMEEEESLERYLRAIGLYQGEFLPKSLAEEWTMSLRTYYSSIFTDCIVRAFELLVQRERFGEAVVICEKAVSLEKYSEKMHELLIRAYMAKGDHAAALKHYYYTVDMFYADMGVKVSSQITDLYNEITKSISNIEADLGMIESQLHETEVAPGAYFCTYEIFRNIYRIQSRYMLRSGQSFMVALISISDEQDNLPEQAVITEAMGYLKSTLVHALRKSDVVSRFSPTQYVLLLGSLTYENGQMVLGRIFDRFKRRSKALSIKVHYNLLPVKPTM